MFKLFSDDDEYYEVDDLEEIHSSIVNNDIEQVGITYLLLHHLIKHAIMTGHCFIPARLVFQRGRFLARCCTERNW